MSFALLTTSDNTKRLAQWLLLLGLVVSVCFAFFTKNPYDTGDSITHYLYARFAPQHPLNLMHSWAKPLFTLLAMGPAQFGYQGIVLWQCGLVAASAWLSYWVAERLGVPYAALAILLCYTAPDYFRIQFSGLTEPLFGFVLIASVALLVGKKPGWSAALVSWLPFVRSEGFILLGLWVLYLAWQRQWRALPALLLGYVAYSIVGGIVLGDFGWVFGRNAYPTLSTYGHGNWKTYLVALLYLMGWVMTLLVALGGVQLVWRASRKANWTDPLFQAELLVVYGAVAAFVGAHTLFWVFGLFGSAGLTRVLTVLTPLLAIIALRGLSLLLALGHTPAARQRIALAVAGLAVVFLFTGLPMEMQWERDFGQPGDAKLAEEAASWYRQLPGPRRPVSLESAAPARALDLDMFDYQARPLASVGGKLQLEKLPVGTLVFWDSWFSPMEGGLPLDRLQKDPHFRQRWAGSAYGHANDPNSGQCQLVVFEKVSEG